MSVTDGFKVSEVGVIPQDWDVKKLGDIADVIMGQSPLGSSYNQKGEGIALINGPTEFTNRYPIKIQWTNSPTKICQPGDILLCIRGSSTGRMNISNDEYCIGRGVAAIRAKLNYTNSFLEFQVYNAVKLILKLSVGSTFPNIDSKSLKNLQLPLPPLAEQKAIAQSLSDVDNLITAIDKLITKKRNIKQGTMQELLTGKKRLPGFSGEWEVKEFPDVCWFQEGPGLRQWQFTKQGMKVINVTNLENGYLNLDRTDRYISIEEFRKMYQHFEVNDKDIVVASSGNSYCKVAVVRKQDLPLMMNTSVIRFKPLHKLEYHFLLYFLKSNLFKDQIDLLVTGGAQPNFGLAHLKKVIISIPDFEEQKAIAKILTEMDKEIEALEKKREKYKNIKQGMMQELLTGKTRIIDN
jgi:type I restriction enzyme S subunit